MATVETVLENAISFVHFSTKIKKWGEHCLLSTIRLSLRRQRKISKKGKGALVIHFC